MSPALAADRAMSVARTRSDALRYALPMAACVVAGCVGLAWTFLSSDITQVLLAFSTFTVITVAASNDRCFTSPTALFALFYYPYSTWYAYNRLVGDIAYTHESLLVSLQLAYVGLFAFVLAGAAVAAIAVLLTRLRRSPLLPRMHGTPMRAGMALNLMTLVTMGLVLLGVVEAMLSGATSKRELVDAASPLQQVTALMAVVLAACVVLSVRLRGQSLQAQGRSTLDALLQWRVVLPFGTLLLAMLATGERDYLFRFGFCVLAAYASVTRRVGAWMLFALIVGLALILPVTQALKALLLPGSTQALAYSVEAVFGGEFLASSRNTYMMVDFGVHHDTGFLLGDVARGLLPFGGADAYESSGSWYNRVFRVEHGFAGTSGWGFGLVPLGLLVGGTAGVATVLAGVSIALHAIYFLRGRSEWWMTFYILALSATIYCIRADLANFLSQVFKIAGLAVIVLYVGTQTLRFAGRLARADRRAAGATRSLPH